MRTRLKTALLALLLAGTCAAHAGDDALYRALGDQAGVASLMTDFVTRLKRDTRTEIFFRQTRVDGLAEALTDQVCVLAGGPCKYEGATMAKAHADLAIGRADFNALVEVLQDTMDERGIPFATQNRLLALLAPMHRDIVTR